MMTSTSTNTTSSNPPSSPPAATPVVDISELDPAPHSHTTEYESLPATNGIIDKENNIQQQNGKQQRQQRLFGQTVSVNSNTNSNTNVMPQQQQQQYGGPLSMRHASGGGRRGWVDHMVKAATACNSLVQKNYCNMCHVYTNRQVEFEQKQQNNNQMNNTDQNQNQQHPQDNNNQQRLLHSSAPPAQSQDDVYEYFVGGESTTNRGATGSPTSAGRVWRNMQSGLEVDMYRQFLFDEASVGGDGGTGDGNNNNNDDDDDGMRFLDAAMSSAVAAVVSGGKAVRATPSTNIQYYSSTPVASSTHNICIPGTNRANNNGNGLEEC